MNTEDLNNNMEPPVDRLAVINQLKTIIEDNRDRLRQIVAEAELGEWDRESALAEAEKLKSQALAAARLMEQILRSA